MSVLRHVIAAIALAFFFLPLVLLALGLRATEFENRQLADPPSVTDGWDAFDGATRYLVDHLPMREQAVRFNTWKSLNVFGTTPNYGNATNPMPKDAAAPFAGGAGADQRDADEAATPPDAASQVLVGQDGWLYLQGDLDRACSPFLPFDPAVRRWERLGQLVAASGRDVVVVIAPDKSTIYPEHLPRDLPQRACADAARSELWGRLEASKERTLLPLRQTLLAAKDDFPHDIYHETDSHWNGIGASRLVREVAPRLGGRTISDGDVVPLAKSRHVGDLGNLLGAPREESDLPVEIQRSSDDPRIPGRTTYVLDSYGLGTLAAIKAETVELETRLWAQDKPEDIIASIVNGDAVILQTVEREVTWRALELLTDDFLAALQRALAADPR